MWLTSAVPRGPSVWFRLPTSCITPALSSRLCAEGEAAWRRFNAGREDQLWYYRELVDALREAGGLEDLVEELDEVVGEINKPEA
jgi:hypothetical protein